MQTLGLGCGNAEADWAFLDLEESSICEKRSTPSKFNLSTKLPKRKQSSNSQSSSSRDISPNLIVEGKRKRHQTSQGVSAAESRKYRLDGVNDSPERDLDFEASYDGDSDMDLKGKLRRKLKKERKDAIMSGVQRFKHEGDHPTRKHE